VKQAIVPRDRASLSSKLYEICDGSLRLTEKYTPIDLFAGHDERVKKNGRCRIGERRTQCRLLRFSRRYRKGSSEKDKCWVNSGMIAGKFGFALPRRASAANGREFAGNYRLTRSVQRSRKFIRTRIRYHYNVNSSNLRYRDASRRQTAGNSPEADAKGDPNRADRTFGEFDAPVSYRADRTFGEFDAPVSYGKYIID